MPSALIAVPELPPLTVQVTVWAGLPVPFTVAVKVWVPPFVTLPVAGLTITAVTVAGGAAGSPLSLSPQLVSTSAAVTTRVAQSIVKLFLIIEFLLFTVVFYSNRDMSR
jgi:hypothetical protein